jgi:hypothetical protein
MISPIASPSACRPPPVADGGPRQHDPHTKNHVSQTAACHRAGQHVQAVGQLRRQGQPAPGTSTCVVRTWPLPGATISAALMPRHSAATMNSVVLPGPPRAQAKPPRSSSTVCSTVPPSATRTHRLPGTSAYQTAFCASAQMPSGVPSPRSAQTRAGQTRRQGRYRRPPAGAGRSPPQTVWRCRRSPPSRWETRCHRPPAAPSRPPRHGRPNPAGTPRQPWG